jgi:hypothetical protein
MIGIERQKCSKKGRYGTSMRYGKLRRNERKATIGTAHTVTVNSLIESIESNQIKSACHKLIVVIWLLLCHKEWIERGCV